MALTLKKPIATLHKKEQHISIKTLRKTKRSAKKTNSKSIKHAFKQLSLFK